MDYKEKVIELLKSKELSKEEKARLEKIFPELKESEDERIRKEITELVMQPTWKTEKEFYRRKELCAWVEKQGEQNLIEWNEKDEDRLDKLVWELKQKKHQSELGLSTGYSPEFWEETIMWLKSLKDRCIPQPSEWSKEDYERLDNFIEWFEGVEVGLNQTIKEDYSNWLKSLKPQTKQEWSKEDVAMLDSAIAFVEHSTFTTIGKGKSNVIAWLKSIRDKAQPQTQPKQEWSLEDLQFYGNIQDAVTLDDDFDESYKKKILDWLKSLRHKVKWKPSDEQMLALQEAMNIVGILTITGSKINSLYQDLKKLKK